MCRHRNCNRNIAEQLKEALIEQADDNLTDRPHRLKDRIFFEENWTKDKQIDLVLNKLERTSRNASQCEALFFYFKEGG